MDHLFMRDLKRPEAPTDDPTQADDRPPALDRETEELDRPEVDVAIVRPEIGEDDPVAEADPVESSMEGPRSQGGVLPGDVELDRSLRSLLADEDNHDCSSSGRAP